MHRDLKPENMILADKGDLLKTTLKLVDFGLSSFCDKNPYLFNRCGTPGFVAPEIIKSSGMEHHSFQPKVDVFSAGIIFYTLLVGKSPFQANSFKKILNLNKASRINYSVSPLKNNPVIIDLL